MEKEFSFSEFYDVVLKTTYPIEIDGRTIEQGEVIASFDKINLCDFDEVKKRAQAEGGFDNRGWVFWEETKEVKLAFTQGIFSKTQFGLLTNSKLITPKKEKGIILHKREKIETDETGRFCLLESPLDKIFIYNAESGRKIADVTELGNDVYQIGTPYTDIIVDYNFCYEKISKEFIIGQRLINGFLELEGKTKTQDDITGCIRTGIIKIPKLKLMSELSIRLGNQANPITGLLEAKAIPVGPKGRKKVMEIFFLEDDIDSDI